MLGRCISGEVHVHVLASRDGKTTAALLSSIEEAQAGARMPKNMSGQILRSALQSAVLFTAMPDGAGKLQTAWPGPPKLLWCLHAGLQS